jgi:hypothetical protein
MIRNQRYGSDAKKHESQAQNPLQAPRVETKRLRRQQATAERAPLRHILEREPVFEWIVNHGFPLVEAAYPVRSNTLMSSTSAMYEVRHIGWQKHNRHHSSVNRSPSRKPLARQCAIARSRPILPSDRRHISVCRHSKDGINLQRWRGGSCTRCGSSLFLCGARQFLSRTGERNGPTRLDAHVE